MKTSTQRATGDQKPSAERDKQHVGRQHASHEASAPLPHETDQSPESQHEDDARGIGKQAHRDVEQGLEDTDRRGGDDYQERTQNDAHANRNSRGKGTRKH
ncbi:hypothetical protein KZJ38_10270 [Paraburkholderia edwinii]|jgi:hypothetical protein|uniref:Uncharacterized protein n=1 Tax=Paraburkholderia edwinii TaxID=2861782 RepID=A0ABX8UUM9_9BURK|nr:hypothetical protein [Paraburkholderia edwinii]QYD70630.1 hypothetical protein KZJ38_10270 [Paraburkholderia edwinii]